MDNPLAPKQKTIRLGSVKLTITEAGWLEDMRLFELEQDAIETNKKEFEEAQKEGKPLTHTQLYVQYFRHDYYPKLAACIVGKAPDFDTSLRMPSKRRQIWYDAVHEINPQWFTYLDELARQVDNQANDKNKLENRKKKEKKPAK